MPDITVSAEELQDMIRKAVREQAAGSFEPGSPAAASSNQLAEQNPRSVEGWMQKINPNTTPKRNYSRAEAEHIMLQEVFGHDVTFDAAGNPIEKGKGSAAQPTQQHREALAKELERQMLTGTMHH
jgi:hypothetical protein